MMPKDTAWETVTVYHYSRIEEQETYGRIVVRGVALLRDSKAQYKKTGTANTDATTLLFPWDAAYGAEWDVVLGGEVETTYIVQGECPFDFTPGTGDTFVLEQVKPFEKAHSPIRPREVIPRRIGSRHLWHVEVRC